MRIVGLSSTAVAFGIILSCGPAGAQGLEGPLAGPGAAPSSAAPSAKHQPTKHSKAKTKTSRAEVLASPRLPATPTSDVPSRDLSKTPAASPTAPISFGMKWSGTNESGRETRFDNLNGGYAGTGGEVGLKLPF